MSLIARPTSQLLLNGFHLIEEPIELRVFVSAKLGIVPLDVEIGEAALLALSR